MKKILYLFKMEGVEGSASSRQDAVLKTEQMKVESVYSFSRLLTPAADRSNKLSGWPTCRVESSHVGLMRSCVDAAQLGHHAHVPELHWSVRVTGGNRVTLRWTARSDSARPCQTGPDSARQCQRVPDSARPCQTVPDSARPAFTSQPAFYHSPVRTGKQYGLLSLL